MECIKVHTVKSGKIDGLSVDEFIDSFEGEILYLIDVDSHFRREMNLKVYEDLSGLFEMWIDSAPRRHYDVMDALILGGTKVVITPYFTRWKEISRSLELTENVVLKSLSKVEIENFLEEGGKEVITSTAIAPSVNARVYVIKSGEVCQWMG